MFSVLHQFCFCSSSILLLFYYCSIWCCCGCPAWQSRGQLHREGFEEILQESNSNKFVDICWTISEVRYIQIYAYNCYSGFQLVSVDTISQQFLLFCPMNVIFGLCSFFLSWLSMRMPHMTIQRTTPREFLFSLVCVRFSVLVANEDATQTDPEDNSEGIFVFFALCSFFCLGCQSGCRTWLSRGQHRGNGFEKSQQESHFARMGRCLFNNRWCPVHSNLSMQLLFGIE